MVVYADSSFLVSTYLPDDHSESADRTLAKLSQPLIFTSLQRHEVRNAVRLSVFRKEISRGECVALLAQIDRDVRDGILLHTQIDWRNAYREVERLGAVHTEKMGLRAADLLHVALAVLVAAERFLTFDARQRKVAAAEGLRVGPG